jgi:glycosyltransferase involved in cell wall biosynthesis
VTEGRPSPSEVTAVVPARNAATVLPECLSSLRASGVAEIIVVDGLSSDDTVHIAERSGAVVLSDEGKGLPAARLLGAERARTPWILLVDADVVFPPGALDGLLREFVSGGYDALQAGLESVGGPGFWGRALAYHHVTGRSRRWFGLVATVFRRDDLLAVGFDDRFRSGEDIDLRWRLRDRGLRAGVSTTTTVRHRFVFDDFAFAKDQFLMDGTGLGRMVRTRRWRGAALVLLPGAAAIRGSALALLSRQPQWIRYFSAFALWNYVGMARGLRDER